MLVYLCLWVDFMKSKISCKNSGDRAKLLPYTNFYVEVLTQYWIKLLHVEVLTNVRIKLLHIEVLTIVPDKTSTLTKSIKNPPPPSPPTLKSTSINHKDEGSTVVQS